MDPGKERTRAAVHCEWAVLALLVNLDGPVTGPSTRSPEVPAAAVGDRAGRAIGARGSYRRTASASSCSTLAVG